MLRPVLHFFTLGAALLAADRLWFAVPAVPAAPAPIVISEQRVEELRRSAWVRGGAALTDREIRALAGAEVSDELLYREALALGFDRDDPVIFNRLVMNMRFAGAGEEIPANELYRESRELGMHLTDIVVRRRLIQRMRLLIESSAGEPPPTEDELRRHFTQRQGELVRHARARFVQRFFSRERAAEARAAVARLADAGPEAADGLGEAFLHPVEQPPQSQQEIASRFGAEFARGVFALTPGRWSGPVPSAYGVHLVYVRELREQVPLEFEEVREQMRYGVLAQRGAQALAEAIAELREGVEVYIEGIDAPRG